MNNTKSPLSDLFAELQIFHSNFSDAWHHWQFACSYWNLAYILGETLKVRFVNLLLERFYFVSQFLFLPLFVLQLSLQLPYLVVWTSWSTWSIHHQRSLQGRSVALRCLVERRHPILVLAWWLTFELSVFNLQLTNLLLQCINICRTSTFKVLWFLSWWGSLRSWGEHCGLPRRLIHWFDCCGLRRIWRCWYLLLHHWCWAVEVALTKILLLYGLCNAANGGYTRAKRTAASKILLQRSINFSLVLVDARDLGTHIDYGVTHQVERL